MTLSNLAPAAILMAVGFSLLVVNGCANGAVSETPADASDALAAAGDPQRAAIPAPASAEAPAVETATPIVPAATASPTATAPPIIMFHGSPVMLPNYEVEELFLRSDVVARVRLIQVDELVDMSDNQYRARMAYKFDVLEWLRGGNGGSGPIWGIMDLKNAIGATEQEVRAAYRQYSERRSAGWDGREAIVFMDLYPDSATSRRYWLSRFLEDRGVEGHSLGTYKSWLPAASAGGASGASGDAEFFVEPRRVTPNGVSGHSVTPGETMSLANFRKLAAMSDADLRKRLKALQGFMQITPSSAIPAETGIRALAAVTTLDGVELRWDTPIGAPDVIGYRILRRAQADSEFIQLHDAPANGPPIYEDADVKPETKYIYRLRAYNADGDIADARVAITTVAELEPLDAPAAPAATPTPTPTATPAPAAAPSDGGAPTAPTPTPTPTATPTATPEPPPPGGVTGQ